VRIRVLQERHALQEVSAGIRSTATAPVPRGHRQLVQGFGSVLGVGDSFIKFRKYVRDKSDFELCDERHPTKYPRYIIPRSLYHTRAGFDSSSRQLGRPYVLSDSSSTPATPFTASPTPSQPKTPDRQAHTPLTKIPSGEAAARSRNRRHTPHR
jgi:hypothetical protein